MRSGLLWASSALAIVALACSGSGSTSGDSGVTADQACSDLASALCSKIQTCSSFFFEFEYADMGTCTSRTKTTCMNTMAANGTGQTPSTLEACVQVAPSISCDDVFSNNPPAACQPVAGQLANGMACGDNTQCQSAYCNKGTDGTCGACGTRGSAGTACVRDDDCPYGNLCNCTGGSPCKSSGTCAAFGAASATCDDTHPCKKTLACKNGTCVMPDEAGAACTVGNAANFFGSCDVLMGLVCSPTTKTCAMIGVASAGQMCGLLSNSLTACSAAGTCNMAPMQTTGTCTAAADDGASCSGTTKCIPPANCSGGVCKLPDPSNCH